MKTMRVWNLIWRTAIAGFLGMAVVTTAHGQATPDPTMPRLVEQNGRHALFVDGAPYLMLGLQINNSSAWLVQMPKIWPAVEYLHANTVEMPVYWSQFEPTEGHYDPTQIDMMLAQARAHNVHLVLLWFGTWKNGSPGYAPNWVKLDPKRFPLVEKEDGTHLWSLSPHSKETLKVDSSAFAQLMRHLKEADPQHTVLMVQVENEAGTWGGARDYSPATQALFKANVPAEIAKAMGKKPGASWLETFGPDADEFFHAYSIATYINAVAAAGHAENPLPLYCNVALNDPLFAKRPPEMESGGPTAEVLPIWKLAAPNIQALGPDIYEPSPEKYLAVLDQYSKPDNALFVPEMGNTPVYAHYFSAVLGHGGFGFSPFGMDQTGAGNYPIGVPKMDDAAMAPFAVNYAIAGPMNRVLAKLIFEGKVQGVAEGATDHQQRLHFGKWDAIIQYGQPAFGFGTKVPPGNATPIGQALIAQLGPDEFLVTGLHARVDFELADPAKKLQRMWLQVQQGTYTNDTWKTDYEWNGDQTDYGLNFAGEPQVLKVSLSTF